MSEWTQDRTAILTKMWTEGCSASQIAHSLGGVSRNAVIGRAHRMGLERRKPSFPAPRTPSPKHPFTAVKRAPGPSPRVHVLAPPIPLAVDPVPETGKLFTERRFNQCAWPMTEPSENMMACCKPIVRGSYCGEHAARAYTNSAPRKATVLPTHHFDLPKHNQGRRLAPVRRMTRDQRLRIVALYSEGNSLRRVGQAFGLSNIGVRNVLLHEGCPIRPVGRQPFPSELHAELIALADEIAGDLPSQFPRGAKVADLMDWLGEPPIRIGLALGVLASRGAVIQPKPGVYVHA